MKTTSISDLFEAVSLAILNTTANDEVQKRMGSFGMSPRRMQEGKSLLENAQNVYSKQEQHYDEARRMSVQIEEDSRKALEAFNDHVAIAKAAFRKEPHMLQELKVRRVASAKWQKVQQATDFYSKAPLHMEKLVQYGASEESFQQNRAAVEALMALKAERLRKKGDAENSTQERNEVIKELRNWYGDFRKLARIAFKDNPQILESFGMVVTSYRKKRTETAA